MQPGERLTLEEIAARAGVFPAEMLRVRRALGFGDPAPGERCFVPADAEIMLFILGTAELVGPDLTMQMARAIGTAMSRIAEAEIAHAGGGDPAPPLAGRARQGGRQGRELPGPLRSRPGDVPPGGAAPHRRGPPRPPRVHRPPLYRLGCAALRVQRARPGDRLLRPH